MDRADVGLQDFWGKFQLEESSKHPGFLKYYSDILLIGGWVVLPDASHSFGVFYGDTLIETIVPNGPREDVLAAFPDLPNALRSGFNREISIAVIPLEARQNAVVSLRLSKSSRVISEANVRLMQGEPTYDFHIDNARLVDGALQTTTTNVHLIGWVVAQEQIRSISAELGDDIVLPVQFGISRADVFAVRRTNPNGLNTGFSLFIPELAEGAIDLKFRIGLKTGHVAEKRFSLFATKARDEVSIGSQRSYAERRFWELVGSATTTEKWVIAVLPPPDETPGRKKPRTARAKAGFPGLPATLASIRKVTTGGCGTHILLSEDLRKSKGDESADGFFADAAALGSMLAGFEDTAYVTFLYPGDTLDQAAPAVLAANIQDKIDLIYWDEKATVGDRLTRVRKTPGAPFVTAFQTNAIGRGWAARLAPATIAALGSNDLYHFIAGHPLSAFYHVPHTCRHIPELLTSHHYKQDFRSYQLNELAVREKLLAELPTRFGAFAPLGGASLQSAENSDRPASLRIDAELKSPPIVSIIVPTRATRGRVFKCLEDLRFRTRYKSLEIIVLDHTDLDVKNIDDRERLRDLADIVIPVAGEFNWSRFNNMAAALSTGDVLLFLNDDVEVVTEDWIERLVSYLNFAKVGAVAPRLLLPGGDNVQSAGVSLLCESGWARNDFAFSASNRSLAGGVNLVPRNCTSLLGAAIAVPRNLFMTLGGFEEGLPMTFNDLDFHMRVRALGYQVVVTPEADLIHHEKNSRAELTESEMEPIYWERWRLAHGAGDQYWHADIERETGIYKVDPEPVEAVWSVGIADVRSNVRRILILRLDHVGDFVLTLPAFRQLRSVFPDAMIEIVTGAWNRELAQRANLFDKIHAFNLYAARSGDGRALSSDAATESMTTLLGDANFDLAIDFRADGDTRFLLKHISATTRAGFAQGVNFPWLDISVEWDGNLPQWRKTANGAVQMQRLVSTLELAYPIAETSRTSFWANGAELRRPQSGPRPLAVIHPFAGNEIKMWPAAHWATLAVMMIDAGLSIEIIGMPKEKADNPDLVALLKKAGAHDRIGQFTLPELVDYIATADCFVGSDSGPKHIAASTGIPTVAVQSGFVDPVTWSPFNVLGVSIVKRVSCAPCYLDDVRLCGREHECMHKISPAQVFRHLSPVIRMVNATRANSDASVLPLLVGTSAVRQHRRSR